MATVKCAFGKRGRPSHEWTVRNETIPRVAKQKKT